MRIVENGLTTEIFIFLRREVGFMEYEANDVKQALRNTLFSVVVFEKENPIGCGRVIGDNRIAFIIKDVVVKEEQQGRGIGTIIMNALLAYIGENASLNAYIGLMSTPNKEGFYEKFGFIRRPNKSFGAGMIMYYKGNNKV